jgi:hypothetical protein
VLTRDALDNPIYEQDHAVIAEDHSNNLKLLRYKHFINQNSNVIVLKMAAILEENKY